MLKAYILALALALIAAPASAEVDTRQRALVSEISSQVLRYAHFTIFDDVRVQFEEDRVVVLTGKVTMPFKKDDLGRIAGSVAGVSTVRNEIDILPVSPFDDELRARIARAIYGHASFWHYAAMVNPPIHIIVEDGNVILTGVVQSNVERMLARSLATTYGAFSVRNDLRTDAEMRAAL